jgi:hypothetical protein
LFSTTERGKERFDILERIQLTAQDTYRSPLVAHEEETVIGVVSTHRQLARFPVDRPRNRHTGRANHMDIPGALIGE